MCRFGLILIPILGYLLFSYPEVWCKLIVLDINTNSKLWPIIQLKSPQQNKCICSFESWTYQSCSSYLSLFPSTSSQNYLLSAFCVYCCLFFFIRFFLLFFFFFFFFFLSPVTCYTLKKIVKEASFYLFSWSFFLFFFLSFFLSFFY